jgi:hypothetical protein
LSRARQGVDEKFNAYWDSFGSFLNEQDMTPEQRELMMLKARDPQAAADFMSQGETVGVNETLNNFYYDD